MIAREPLQNKISLIHDLSKEERELSKILNLLIESEKIFTQMSVSLHNTINEIKNGN